MIPDQRHTTYRKLLLRTVALMLIVVLGVGIWAAFWSTCLWLFGHELTETIVSCEEHIDNAGRSHFLVHLRLYDDFGQSVEIKGIDYASKPSWKTRSRYV